MSRLLAAVIAAPLVAACAAVDTMPTDASLAECVSGTWVRASDRECRCTPDLLRTVECDLADCAGREVLVFDAGGSGAQFEANFSDEQAQFSVPGSSATVIVLEWQVIDGDLVRMFVATDTELRLPASCTASELSLTEAQPHARASVALADAVQNAREAGEYTEVRYGP